MITSNGFIELAMRTSPENMVPIIARLKDPNTVRLLHAAMGFQTEAGEFMDIMKRHVFYGKPIDKVNVGEEIGDLFWYAAEAMDVMGFDMNMILTGVIQKLKNRFPDKFSETKALGRDLSRERAGLEESIG